MTVGSVVSLFSGAGGLDLGFIEAGFDVVWANDFDKDAVETYRRNIGNHIVLGDISAIDSSDIPECDVLIGGFPCQGFSLANLKRHAEDERNQLYLQYLRVLSAKKPRVFVAENVKGILSLEKGTVLEVILSDFASAGYTVQYKLLNAADFGVPQTRQRVFIVGVRTDVPYAFSYPEITHSRNAKEALLPWVTVKEALEQVPDPDGADANSVPNNNYSQYKVQPRNFTGHRLTNPDKPSPTILARGNGGGGVCAIPHFNGKRRMSVRESATVQTFPLDFEFVGKTNSCYRQIGNAVPVKLARAIAEQVKEVLGD